MQLTLTGKQIHMLASLVGSDDDQILVAFTNQHAGYGLYATPSAAIPPEWTPLFDTEEATAAQVEAIDKSAQPVENDGGNRHEDGVAVRCTARTIPWTDHGCGLGANCWCDEGQEIAACPHRKGKAGVLVPDGGQG